MLLFFLIVNCFLRFITGIQLNLYNTDPTLDMNNLQVNCLHYYNNERLDLTEKTEYCLGPINEHRDSLNLYSQKLTFDELRQLNISTNELLSWSATIDLVEQYQYYLDHEDNSSLSTEIFFNCTVPWFGPQCQYSFSSPISNSFQSVVRQTLKKIYEYDSSYTMPHITCYIHLQCDRGGSSMCLDWREICDGRIDCVDGGIDEEQCFQLEVNECNEGEYRCHNGLCIPKEFSEDSTAECLDKSDVSDERFNYYKSNLPYIFNYEEVSCRIGSKQFVCGDGECVQDFDVCQNKRHLLLLESVSIQGNLSSACWMIMICLTKILDQVNETSCDDFLTSSHINTYLQSCDDLIQFPTLPVLFGHVRFLYHSKIPNDWNINVVLIPNYICYDERLCDFLTPSYRYGSYVCRYTHQFNFHWNNEPTNWVSFIRVIESYFRTCSTRYNDNIKNVAQHYPSLYCCKNSSKCIAKTRILNNVSDCYLNDDEEQFELSCFIDDILRFRCANENKCYVISVPEEICPPSLLRSFDQMIFQDLCDRHVQMFPLVINGQNHTDETDCEQWPCNNFYTRCDGFWSCPNGEDEENCTEPTCPSHTLPCVLSHNYTLTCLSADEVNNGHIDCLGAIDERQQCRSLIYFNQYYLDFQCWDDDSCLRLDFVCNGYSDCPHNDDEKFCTNSNAYGICHRMSTVDRTNVENAICLASHLSRIKFSLKPISIYPPSTHSNTIENMVEQSIEQRNNPKFTMNGFDNLASLWYCNHGLYVRHRLEGNNVSYQCFCPPTYYGNRCQYQNQRISLTVKVRVMDFRAVYALVIRLIDDNDDRQQVISYHQYTSRVSGQCQQTFNTYLTYATRPKNSSTNYSIRIDVFNKISLLYLASWHFLIPFTFLPVNRLAVLLHIPAQAMPSVSQCPLTCHSGVCMKYMNKETFYCQCYTGWSGVHCNIPLHCSDCSSDSLCIGILHNRPICVCPLNKGGLRCLLKLSCVDFPCLNNSTCLVVDDGMHELAFRCVCPKEFSGLWCQSPANRLDMAIHHIKVSSVVLIYIFSDQYRDADPPMEIKVIVQKLTIFQRTISLYTHESFHMIVVSIDHSYYLALLQHSMVTNISTSIDSNQRCAFITELWNTKQLEWPQIRRVKYYHQICRTHVHILCFIDEPYMCLCTLERHASCFKFNSSPPKCRDYFYCQNQGICLQDDTKCPSTIMCSCTDCFFGDRCQFYAKGIGLTLDDILRYEIRPQTTIDDQGDTVKWSIALIMIIFIGGLVNSILSIITFHTKESRKIGCGIYLLASSITSLLTVCILTVKFWFLVLTQINPAVSFSVVRGGCRLLEFFLKACLYTDNWFNACVAGERLMAKYKGTNFNQRWSKLMARWMIFLLPLLVTASIIHEPLYRDLFYDTDEQRFWCVFHYSETIQIYHTIILFFHYTGPLCVNLLSAVFIIFISRNRQLPYRQYLRRQFDENKNLILSPIILVILTIPGLIISISSNCVKVSHNSWLYLLSYFVSFIPSMTIFLVFVLPSNFYKKQFKKAIRFGRQ